MQKITTWRKYYDAILPTKAKDDAGFDLYISRLANGGKEIKIKPHQTKLVSTGVNCIIPSGYYLQIQERGSTGSLGIKYSAGVIDPSYRGEIFLAITNVTKKTIKIGEYKEKKIKKFTIELPYDKAIFQGLVHKIEEFEFCEVNKDKFAENKTKRGDGKLGSSGK